MNQNQFPIEQVRSKFPALNRTVDGSPLIYFDGPGGTQMVEDAANGMMKYISSGMANLHGTFPTSVATDQLLDDTRAAVADLLGCEAQEVAFGPNMTTLAFAIARSLASFINEGDEIVVTELDHRANVDPWLTLARDRGAVVKFIELDPDTYTLNLANLETVITSKTKLVAAGMSSNVTGTVSDVGAISARAQEVGALMIVDAVHAVPHIPIDFKKIGCDVLLCSAYKFFGPHVGIAAIRSETFEKLPIYKLEPAPGEIPFKLETGTQNHEGIAGLAGAIQFIESLGDGATRRERLVAGVEKIDEYESLLGDEIESFLRGLEGVTLYRAPNGPRTPTFAFTIEGRDSREVCRWFAEHDKLCIADGDFYASTMASKLGVHEVGGWIRVGLAPYNSIEEIEVFKRGMLALLESKVGV